MFTLRQGVPDASLTVTLPGYVRHAGASQCMLLCPSWCNRASMPPASCPGSLKSLRELHLLTDMFPRSLQLSNQLAGLQLSSEAASRSRTVASPTADRHPKTQSPNQQNCPTPPAARAAKPARKRRGSGDTQKTASPASPDEEQPCGGLDLQPPSSGNSGEGSSTARHVARDVRACAGCGRTAEMLENGKLHLCTGCRRVRYCGRACQVANRPAHKAVCKRLQAEE
jgi:hypothetical protein